MITGTNFPISEYYRDRILDAETINRKGGWWTSVLLIEDPQTGQPFVALYRWQLTENGWKVRKSFNVKSSGDAKKLLGAMERFIRRMKESKKESIEQES